MQSIASLNEQYGIDNRIRFQAGPGQFPMAGLANQFGSAVVSVYGGHVLTYQPTDHAPVLWVSDQAQYEQGKAIRGGIPVIWPWFGAHPTDANKPTHGFARKQLWEVVGSRSDGITTAVTLALAPTPFSAEMWSHPFQLELTVTLGAVLDVALKAINLDDNPVTLSAALHSYFTVSDIGQVLIAGLDGARYLDQLDGMVEKTQDGPVMFSAEVDRIYLDTVNRSAEIVDPSLQRAIRVSGRGSNSTVIWNPWTDKAARMADFGNDEFRQMVCVETANADADAVTLDPEASHELATIIEVEPL